MIELPPIAVVGTGGIFPGSPDLASFWQLVAAGKSAAKEVPPGRWALDPERALDPRPGQPDKLYSSRACFIEDFDLDLTGLDISRAEAERYDTMVQLALHAGGAAWRDAITDGIDRNRVGVVLGNIALPTESTSKMADWMLGRTYAQRLGDHLGPGFTATGEPVAPINRYVTGLPAGILAKALGLGGGHFTLDAACASSLFALKHAVDELQSGRADAMLSGGLSRPDCLYTQMGFAQLFALSPSGRCAPFSAAGDGLVVGEGAGLVVLKRLADAEAAGDHIHGVIRGIGLSNDVDGNLLAPSEEGQLRAMRAAYAQAGWQPHDVDLIECHATGTKVGDAVEYGSLRTLWGGQAWQPGQCTIGSVKSNVGHLLTGAGAAGLLKVLLAMREATLPPTAHFESPHPEIDLDQGPFTVRREAAPWPRRADDTPRRAAVSGFGFGGTNAHVLLEEYRPGGTSSAPVPRRTGADEIRAGETGDDVVVVGIGATCGAGTHRTSFQHRVLGNTAAAPPAPKQNFYGQVDPPTGWFLEDLAIRPGAFRIPPKEMEETLPQQLLMLQVAREALDDVGTAALAPLRTGVFIGIGLDLSTTNYHLRWSLRQRAEPLAAERGTTVDDPAFQQWLQDALDGLGPALNANRVMGNLGGIVASRVAREFGIGGPSFVLSSEECSGVSALESAARSLQRGELDAALVGAVDLTGDVRSALATEADRPFDRDGAPRPFDVGAAGTVLGEGAVSLVLKRRRDAEADGDRIYAALRGFGSSTGGAPGDLSPDADAYTRALTAAYADAQLDPGQVDYVEAHGSGDPRDDRIEATALAAFFDGPAVSSAKADIGHTGSAAGLFSIAKACLALHHRILPPLRHTRRLRPEAAGCVALPAAEYWLRDDDRGPRHAGVSAMSVSGAATHVVLEEVVPAADNRDARIDPPPLGPDGAQLFAVEGEERDALIAGLEALADRARLAAQRGDTLTEVAWEWWQSQGQHPERRLGVGLVCQSVDGLRDRAEEAIAAVRAGIDGAALAAQSARRIFYATRPLARDGEIAFVYPGSGSQFLGMGRAMATRWPQVVRRQESECSTLRAQLVPELIWHGDHADLRQEPRRLILAQVALGTLVSDVIQSFGVKPQAVIGYSLGETAGLFSMRAWHERDEMLRRVTASNLFTTELTGPCDAARRTWKLPPEQSVNWRLGVVDRPASAVRAALATIDRAYLLIVNSPDECVIGGQAEAVDQVLDAMGAQFHELHSVTTVHCEVAQAVEQAYRDLHILATDTSVPVRFYSGAAGRSYPLSQEAAAESILDSALHGVDFPKVVEQAYADGVRIFLEMGPGGSCTRMIRKILDGRPFAARAACTAEPDGDTAVIRTLAMLVAERAPIDLTPLYAAPATATRARDEAALIRIPVGGAPFRPPTPTTSPATPTIPASTPDTATPGIRIPAPAASSRRSDPRPVDAAAPSLRMTASTDGTLAAFERAQAATAAAHASYLELSQTLASLAAQAHSGPAYPEVIPGEVSGQGAGSAAARPAPLAPPPPVPSPGESRDAPADASTAGSATPPPLFDRDQCMEIAVGSLANVLGPEFAVVDTHPTRVRLPDEPLMLVDRILSIEGTPRSMTSGRIVTEHDVTADRWYLDNGRIPTCVAVESGQADLFLSGYLGIDFETKGLAVYRLLDAVVTFHDALPGVGETIHYEIQIKEFFRQGDTWLFRFEFEATVNGRPLITMKEGCAGFFTQAELDAGQGIVPSRLEQQRTPGTWPDDHVDLVPGDAATSLDADQVAALRRGDLAAAFGPSFANLPLQNPLTLPTGHMELVHRVRSIDPRGGRYGIGGIVAEADIRPDDWFLTCHFVDDKVMPGTLMYECCLHTLRIYLLRQGWIAEAADVTYQPLLGVRSRLKCRGQVLDTTRLVTYEVSIKSFGYSPEPWAIVDALMYGDGKPIVEISEMSVRLTGVTREALLRTWGHAAVEPSAAPAPRAKPLYDYDRILAFSDGNPSDAFGAPYRVFDADRVIARLPRPPYQFLDRITAVTGEPFVMEAGATCVAEVDVDAEQWYFASNRQAEISFAVLLEMALQPCGWLAAYVGSALTADDDLKFRNLGGDSIQHAPVYPTEDTLRTAVELTQVSHSGGMIIQHYRYEMTNRSGTKIYSGTTYFGFFSEQALAEQLGVRDAEIYSPDAAEAARGRSFPVPREAPFPDDTLRMVDAVDLFVPDGGPAGLGYIRGSIAVDPSMWFFAAHFKQDPVWPGSLGLEAMLQLLKVVAVERWQLGADAVFETFPREHEHTWIYRGQVIPTNRRVEVLATIRSVDDATGTLVADGFLRVDDLTIYEMRNFALRGGPRR